MGECEIHLSQGGVPLLHPLCILFIDCLGGFVCFKMYSYFQIRYKFTFKNSEATIR